MSNPSAKANLIGVLLECIVYGIYFTVFLQTLHIFLRKGVKSFVHVYLASTALVVFALITLRLAIDITIAVQTITGTNGHGSTIFPKLSRLSCATYVALTIIADIFIVYRVFAVWSRSLFVSAAPCSLSIAGIISGGLLASDAGQYGFNEPRHLFTTFYCITLVLNVLSTALIACKLYISERQIELSSSLKLKRTSVIVIESAALYSACVIVIVVCNVTGADDAHLILLLTTPSIIGLTFSLIIVRVAGSSRSTSKTFTSIDDSRGSVLQFTGQLRTDDEAQTGMDACSNGQSSEKVTVVTNTTSATVQLKSPPSLPADDVENRLSGPDMRGYRSQQ
ncbi:hypothetical protein PM082_014078 [Marasmius tenuissimus]|nr:hypothetical protein PM082_014078 [Marasmius tenuissimus]